MPALMPSTTPTPLILASKSPRRHELLRRAGFAFEIQPADIDETPPVGMPLEQVPEYLAREKAKALEAQARTGMVLAADTVVLLEGELIGKPVDEADALALLQKLGGKQHTVVSGVAMLHAGRLHSFSEVTLVHMRALPEEQLKAYIKEWQPLDKAGAYGIQDWIGLVGVSSIQGCFYNVMGLPVSRLVVELEEFLS